MNDVFGKRFKQLRLETGLNQQDFIDCFNNKYNYNFTRQAVSLYETGKRIPEIDALTDFAKFFNVTVDYLLGNSDNKTDDIDWSKMKGDVRFLRTANESEMVKIPVLGIIKAGIPMYAEENIIDYEYIHQEELLVGEETFFLEIKGDSMINARIHDGDRVRIRKQNFIESNGGIYAVNVNGDEATLKRVYIEDDGIRLISENPSYPSMFYPAKDIESGYVNIVGRAVEVKINL